VARAGDREATGTRAMRQRSTSGEHSPVRQYGVKADQRASYGCRCRDGEFESPLFQRRESCKPSVPQRWSSRPSFLGAPSASPRRHTARLNSKTRESVAQPGGQRQVGLLAAGEGGRLITTSGPKSAVVLESSLADNIASPANDIERGGLLRIANPNRRGRWQSCGKTALVSFGRSRR
jgi:hypothetical protein